MHVEHKDQVTAKDFNEGGIFLQKVKRDLGRLMERSQSNRYVGVASRLHDAKDE